MVKETCYIFLDIDGVLNDNVYTEKCYEKHHKPMSMNHVPFNPKSLQVLMELCQELENMLYEVKIILSSTWRLGNISVEIIQARLAEYGLTISNKTSYIDAKRGLEIKEFLKDKKDYKFVILDDEVYDICEVYPDNFVKIDAQIGLSVSDKNKALHIINGG